MKFLHLTGVLTSALLISVPVIAAPPQEVQVDYSADSTMETEGGMTMKARLYHTPGKDRTEMGGPQGMTMIIRKDKQVMWQLMGEMYMEMPLNPSKTSGLDAFDIVEQTEVGQETVNGLKTTKSKIVAVKKDGTGKFGGFFWLTKEGIPVKMDMLSKEGEQKFRMTSELTNVKIEKQDPALFEIPAGYTKNDMGAMMGGAGMPNLEEIRKQAEERRANRKQRPDGQTGDSMGGQIPDVNKMMKGLFGK